MKQAPRSGLGNAAVPKADGDTRGAPGKVQLVLDDTLAYCDPVTGICTVPAPPKPSGKPGSEKRAETTGQDS